MAIICVQKVDNQLVGRRTRKSYGIQLHCNVRETFLSSLPLELKLFNGSSTIIVCVFVSGDGVDNYCRIIGLFVVFSLFW